MELNEITSAVKRAANTNAVFGFNNKRLNTVSNKAGRHSTECTVGVLGLYKSNYSHF